MGGTQLPAGSWVGPALLSMTKCCKALFSAVERVDFVELALLSVSSNLFYCE
jgi:hypothetical protein